MDFGLIQPGVFVGMPAVENPIAIDPDAITVGGPCPLGQRRRGAVAVRLRRADPSLPLNADGVFILNTEEVDLVGIGIQLQFEIEVMGIVIGKRVDRRDMNVLYDSCR